MIFSGEEGGEKSRFNPLRIFRSPSALTSPPTPDQELRQKLDEQIKNLSTSVGTEPDELLGYGAKLQVDDFLEAMRRRGTPGGLRLPVSNNQYMKGYLIGATECADRDPADTDSNGPYHSKFAARVYLCEDGRLRSQVKAMFVPSALETSGFSKNPDIYSDVLMHDGFKTGQVKVSPETGETRFYPASLEELLTGIADANPPR